MDETLFKSEQELQDYFDHPLTKSLQSQIMELSKGQDLNNIKLPFIIKNKILMSPGVWNGKHYSINSIQKGFEHTDWDSKEIRSLFLDHEDDNKFPSKAVSNWVGEVQNPRLEGDEVKGDLHIVDLNTARKLAYGARFGISPRLMADEFNDQVSDFQFENFSVVFTPAVKTAYINNSQELIEDEEVPKMDKEELRSVIAEVLEEELKKKKYPYPEEGKKKEYPYPEEEKKKEKKYPEEDADKEKEKKYPPESGSEDLKKKDKYKEACGELSEEELAGVAEIVKKAKQIRKEGEAWKAALRRAAKMMGEDEEESEELKKKKPEEEPKELEELQKVKEELSELKKKMEAPDRKTSKSSELKVEELSEKDKLMLYVKHMKTHKGGF